MLEALFFLGRGRSFRSGQTSTLIQTGAAGFTIYAEVASGASAQRLGVRATGAGLEIHVDGETGVKSDLAAGLPVQVIEPQIHDLIQGGPQNRRRFLDWGVFHVKHEFLDAWRRYRRALQQRNSALRAGNSRDSVRVWDQELIESGNSVDSFRRAYLDLFQPALGRLSDQLLGLPAQIRYQAGWSADREFAAALEASWDRDQAVRSTQVGPHRAELAIELQDQPARHRLSRGQQKLLAAALVLAQSEFVALSADREVALLVDEPAAELDADHLHALISALPRPGLQLFFSALTPDALPLSEDTRKFHVEHGEVTTLL